MSIGDRIRSRLARMLLLDQPERPENFFAISAVTFLLWTGSSILIPVLPLYTVSLGLSYTDTGLVVGAFYAGRLLFNLAGGHLADRRSLRAVAVSGCLVTAAAATAAGFADTFVTLVGARFIQGAGAGLYLTAALAVIVRTAPAGKVGRYTSLYQGIGLLGFTFGPVIGGLLAQLAGLRAPFFGYAVAGAIGLVIALTRFPSRSRTAGRAVEADHSLTVRPTGVGRSERSSLTSRPYVLALTVAGIIFWLRAGILNSLVPLLASGELGMAEGSIGLMFAASGVGNVAILGRAGRSMDRGRRPALLWSTIGSGIFVIALGFAGSSLWLVAACVFATTATGYASVTPTVVAADSVERASQGRAIGLLRVTTDLALLVGPILSGIVSDAFGLRAGIISAGIATLLVAAVAAIWLPETRPVPPEDVSGRTGA